MFRNGFNGVHLIIFVERENAILKITLFYEVGQ